MYVETLDGVFHHGQVDGSPDFVKIHWVLHEARHCDSCIKIAAGSPYTKKTLPAVPRDGTSHCLSNCRCELRFEYAEKAPAPTPYVIKGPKAIVPPAGYRLPTDKERDKLGAISSEIDRLRTLITVTKGDAKKELIFQRRDLNRELIDYMEKHKVYYVPGIQLKKQKMIESLSDECKELLFEGGAGSGNWGHRGRPGHVGGSQPSGKALAHVGVKTVSSSRMADYLKKKNVQGKYLDAKSALEKLKQKFPGQPDDRYGRALIKAGAGSGAGPIPKRKVLGTPVDEVVKILKAKGVKVTGMNPEVIHGMLSLIPKRHLENSSLKRISVLASVADVTKEFIERTGKEVAPGQSVDGFFDDRIGELTIGANAGRHTFYHEFAHSLLILQRAHRGEIWRANASTGKITGYGASKPAEAFAEGYALAILHGVDSLSHRSPAIGRIYGRVMS